MNQIFDPLNLILAACGHCHPVAPALGFGPAHRTMNARLLSMANLRPKLANANVLEFPQSKGGFGEKTIDVEAAKAPLGRVCG